MISWMKSIKRCCWLLQAHMSEQNVAYYCKPATVLRLHWTRKPKQSEHDGQWCCWAILLSAYGIWSLLKFTKNSICHCSLRIRKTIIQHNGPYMIERKIYYFEILPSIVQRSYWWQCRIQQSFPQAKMYDSDKYFGLLRHHRPPLL